MEKSRGTINASNMESILQIIYKLEESTAFETNRNVRSN